ncbi:hypothetical protein A8V01_03685 [Novosphingobium guangzhouense]|uniref:DUF306 domain-containing protein n=1 Tax=Novosphingobium guangzhouense TaxID=1850347 RepID=A0A2K2G2C7_9SPHN|nr:hypothetical protein A8V01_03685 [Novosphingobium guangzhouense]
MEHSAQGQWRFTSIDGDRPLSTDAQVSFAKEWISVQAGCSRLQGPWRIDAERLVAGPFDQSEAACPNASWQQGNAVNALLTATPLVTVDGKRMVLRSSGHVAELTRTGA